ncbi:MAG: response regulator [Limisphaerales bacterium]
MSGQVNDRTRGLVFVVDDQEIFAEVVAAILRSEDFDTRTFESGEDAVEEVERGAKPDILLTDYVMPGMSGMELIMKCRTLLDGLKTVLFSGQVNDEILSKYGVQPDRFIGKPFQPTVLLDLIAELRV